MDPNSAHQLWSRWTFTVVPGRRHWRPFGNVRDNCARFGRKAFGAASEMHVEQLAGGAWRIGVRSEGHPAHDPLYVEWMLQQWLRFFVAGFGSGTTVQFETRIEAGDRQDGRPADQLVLVPPIIVRGADV